MDNNDLQQFMKDLNVFDLQALDDIKRRPDILGNLRYDVTPRMIMAPRVCRGGEKLPDISGYMFYIEASEEPPRLMLMKIGKSDITSTVGKVEEIPDDLIRQAIDEPPDPPANDMYAITPQIEDWLRRELDI